MKRQLVAAGDGIAVDDGNDGQGAEFDRAQHQLDAARAAAADGPATLGHVEAGAEHVALATDHHDTIVGRDGRPQRVDHLVDQFAVECVALLRPVHPDGFDRAALLDDDFGHVGHSGSMPAALISLVHQSVSAFT